MSKGVPLNVMDRVLLLSILPPKGTIITMRIVSEFQLEQVGFSDTELKDWEIEQTDTGVIWNGDKVKNKSIMFNSSIIGVLKERIEKLDNEGEITPQHLALIEKLDL